MMRKALLRYRMLSMIECHNDRNLIKNLSNPKNIYKKINQLIVDDLTTFARFYSVGPLGRWRPTINLLL